MKRFAALAALVVAAVAVGVYFGTRGRLPVPSVPKAEQNPILEEARAKGVIAGYRPMRRGFQVVDADIVLEFPNACGQQAGACGRPPILWIEYGPGYESRAAQLFKLARRHWDGPVESFETTTLDAHTPDARIMLIPKAGA